jgi:hypothetical protein
MSVRFLSETIVTQVQKQIKDNISAALADIRTDRIDAKVTTEPPQSYFIYEKAKGFRTPACFTILRQINFQKDTLGANHITGRANMNVTVVIEDKDAEKLSIKAWRYQAALHEVLDQKVLTVTDKAKLFLIVDDALFSPIYTAQIANGPEGVFRQEMALDLRIEHREAF